MIQSCIPRAPASCPSGAHYSQDAKYQAALEALKWWNCADLSKRVDLANWPRSNGYSRRCDSKLKAAVGFRLARVLLFCLNLANLQLTEWQ